MAEEARWYVVHTYSGYENKVKDSIQKTVINRNMQDLIQEVEVPLEDSVEERSLCRGRFSPATFWSIWS